MSASEIKKRFETLFPKADAIAVENDFAPHKGQYADGTLYLINGEVRRWLGASETAYSPICVEQEGMIVRRPLGPAMALSDKEGKEAMEAALNAYDKGRGEWPTMHIGERLERLKNFVSAMKKVREETVRLLMWEIGKTRADSEKEFDRTVQYIFDTIEAVKELDRTGGRFSNNSGILAQIRRAPLGVTLCMGPFNYPLNETYTTLIPALIMGNPIVAKLPRFGIFCQAPLMKCFADSFPKGVVNIINGDGRTLLTHVVSNPELASLAFIGTTKVANILKKQHPMPNRLRCILGMEAKNAGIILPDSDLDLTVSECVTGALSFNGQRCTGLKLLFVHQSIAERFVDKLSAAVDALPFGMPWEKGVKLTPLPEFDKPKYLDSLVQDALSKGARIANSHGGLTHHTFYFPPVVFPVKPDMQLYTVEQFGPVVPVAVYKDVKEVLDYVVNGNYGQQVSIFGRDPNQIGKMVDVLANQVCRINLNAQCQRGPDVFPFAGRKDSAEGTLSVSDALRCFSIRSMVAAPESDANKELLKGVLGGRTSNFINTDYIF